MLSRSQIHARICCTACGQVGFSAARCLFEPSTAIVDGQLPFACADVNAQIKGETERTAKLQIKHEQLEREQRRAIEEAEKELCAFALQDEAVTELQNEQVTLMTLLIRLPCCHSDASQWLQQQQ